MSLAFTISFRYRVPRLLPGVHITGVAAVVQASPPRTALSRSLLEVLQLSNSCFTSKSPLRAPSNYGKLRAGCSCLFDTITMVDQALNISIGIAYNSKYGSGTAGESERESPGLSGAVWCGLGGLSPFACEPGRGAAPACAAVPSPLPSGSGSGTTLPPPPPLSSIRVSTRGEALGAAHVTS